MRQAVRGIIVHDNKLLVMKRDKFGHEYYTLVGGHIEPGEEPVQALLREIHEETGIVVRAGRQVYLEHASVPYGDQLIFLCDYASGDQPMLRPDSDEALISQMGQNLYLPLWLPIKDLATAPFRSQKLAKKLIKHLEIGFPETVQEFTSQID